MVKETPALSGWTLGGNPGAAPWVCAPLCGLASKMLGEPVSPWLCSAPDTFWKNPQFLLSVWRPQEGRRFQMPCSVLVSLLQKPRHRQCNKKSHLAISFYLFRVGGPLMESYPFFLFPVLFTIHLCLPTSFSVYHGCKSLGICDLERATFLHLNISFYICKMGTMIFMQKVE